MSEAIRALVAGIACFGMAAAMVILGVGFISQARRWHSSEAVQGTNSNGPVGTGEVRIEFAGGGPDDGGKGPNTNTWTYPVEVGAGDAREAPPTLESGGGGGGFSAVVGEPVMLIKRSDGRTYTRPMTPEERAMWNSLVHGGKHDH